MIKIAGAIVSVVSVAVGVGVMISLGVGVPILIGAELGMLAKVVMAGLLAG
jgi:hypothetical protein